MVLPVINLETTGMAQKTFWFSWQSGRCLFFSVLNVYFCWIDSAALAVDEALLAVLTSGAMVPLLWWWCHCLFWSLRVFCVSLSTLEV